MSLDWDDLPDESAPEPVVVAALSVDATDLEQLSITNARIITNLPLGCRMEFLTRESVRVSVGMRCNATFNQDEWIALVALYERREANLDKLPDWIAKKAHSRNEFKIWMDKDLDLGGDYRAPGDRPGTTVGEVCEAWGLKLTRVAAEF